MTTGSKRQAAAGALALAFGLGLILYVCLADRRRVGLAAAAVAAITAGLEGQEHMPKEGRLAMVPSMMVAAAMPQIFTVG